MKYPTTSLHKIKLKTHPIFLLVTKINKVSKSKNHKNKFSNKNLKSLFQLPNKSKKLNLFKIKFNNNKENLTSNNIDKINFYKNKTQLLSKKNKLNK